MRPNRPLELLVVLLISLVALLVVLKAAGAATIRTASKQPRRLDGLTIEQWRWRAVRNRRTINELNRTIPVLRRQLIARLDRVVWLVDAFRCVHVYEGAWSANTGNGYYGGLQMDVRFQRAYGRELLASKGTANNWTAAEQMAVAITAHASRGFWPWPNTARRCGLLR